MKREFEDFINAWGVSHGVTVYTQPDRKTKKLEVIMTKRGRSRISRKFDYTMTIGEFDLELERMYEACLKERSNKKWE